MRMTKNGIRLFGTTALLSLALGVTGCHTPGRSTGQVINDKLTAHSVSSALGDDPVLKFPNVQVNVYKGTAQLTGFVSTEEQRARAAQIAAGVQGVAQVINEITIHPTPTGRAEIRSVGNGREMLNEPNGQQTNGQQPNEPTPSQPPPR